MDNIIDYRVIFNSKYIKVIEYLNKHGYLMRKCINKRIVTAQPKIARKNVGKREKRGVKRGAI